MLLAVLYARYLWEWIWDAASGENCDVTLPLSCCCSCCLVAITNVPEISSTRDRGHSFSQYGPTKAGE